MSNHMGRWRLGRHDSNRQPRAQKPQDAPGWDCGLLDEQDDAPDSPDAQGPHQAPGRST